MKGFLVALNIFLAVVLAYGLVANLKDFLKQREDAATAGLKRVKKKKGSEPARKNVVSPQAGTAVNAAVPGRNEEEMIRNVAEKNIFNPERSPNAGVRRGRVQLTLVGTFTAGKVAGAIIKHNFQQNNNANLFGPMGLFGMGQGMMPPREITTRSGGGGRAGRRGGTQTGGGMRSGSGGMRGGGMRAGGMRGGMMMGMMGNQSSISASSSQRNAHRQYVRIGETLSNGYTLVEVSRTKAVLTRGSDKMELEIQEASKGNRRRTAPRRQSFSQTMQSLMQQNLRQMQNMARQNMYQNRMMQNMMRQTMQNQRGSAGRRRR